MCVSHELAPINENALTVTVSMLFSPERTSIKIFPKNEVPSLQYDLVFSFLN